MALSTSFKRLLYGIPALVVFLFMHNLNLPDLQAQDFWGRVKAPFTSEIVDLSVDPDDNIYAATWGDGVYKSDDHGDTWARISDGLDVLHINDIDFDASGNAYAATEGGGVYFLGAGTTTWQAYSDAGLTNKEVRAIAVADEDNIYAGTYGSGVFKTNEDGSWVKINKGLHFQDIRHLEITGAGNIIIAATWGGGVYRSLDGGLTWKEQNTGLNGKYIKDMKINSGGEIFVSALGEGVYFSANQGLSWAKFLNTYPENEIYCFSFNSDNQLVIGTASMGVHWFDDAIFYEWTDTDITSVGVNAMVTAANGDIFTAIPYYGVYKSENKGRDWERVGFNNNNGFELLETNRFSGRLFTFVDDTGLFFSDNRGDSWQDMGLATERISDVAGAQNGDIYVAAENSGLLKSDDDGATFDVVRFVDSLVRNVEIMVNGDIYISGTHVVESQQNPIINPFIAKSEDNGNTWEVVRELDDEQEGLAKDISGKPNGNVYVSLSGGGILRTTNGGDSWTRIADFDDVEDPNFVEFNSNGWIFSNGYEALRYSTDEGGFWNDIKFGRTASSCIDIGINQYDNMIAVIAGVNDVYYTKNEGATYANVTSSYAKSEVHAVESDNQGYTYLGNQTIFRQLDPDELDPPLTLAPANNDYSVSTTVTLSWEAAPKAELYELQVSTSPDFSMKTEFVTTSETQRQLETILDNNSTYFWRLRSRVHESVSDWTAALSFTTKLAAPNLVFPVNGAKGVEQTSMFSWDDVEGALRYTIQISDDPEFDNIVIEQDSIDNKTVEISGLDPLTDYYWRVKAFNDENESEFSEAFMFTTVLPPPVLISPEDGTAELETEVTMEWLAAETAEEYVINVARDDGFIDMIFEGNIGDVLEHTLTILEYNTTYYWRVQALNEDGASLFSEIWTFSTGIEPPELISPENETVNLQADVTLRWREYEDIDFYHLQVAEDQYFERIAFEDSLTDPEIQVPDLENGRFYYWKVRLISGDRTGFWSEVRKFRTELAAVTLTRPDDNSTDQNTTVMLEWEELQGAEEYIVQLAKDDVFNTGLQEDTVETTFKTFSDLESGETYYWRIRGIDQYGMGDFSEIWNFTIKSSGIFDNTAEEIEYLQAYPNPFTDDVELRYFVKEPSNIRIMIFDAAGRQLADDARGIESGERSFRWQPENLPQGTYILTIATETGSMSIKLNLVK